MKEQLEFCLYRFMIILVSIFPFRLIYFFSDLLAFKLRYVFRYRKKVIDSNLLSAFPEKTIAERHKIRRGFYIHLSDVLCESLKSQSFSQNQKNERFKISNPEILDEFYYKKQSCVLMMAHYANWEWITLAPHYIKHKWCSIYKPLRNKKIDFHLSNIRHKSGMYLFPQEKTGFMIKNNIHVPSVFTYISDQNPGTMPEEPFWVEFLNRPTACHSGAEILARKFNLPVFYLDVRRIARGKYSAAILPLCLNPETTFPGEIISMYMNKLESIIINEPSNWLWSHKRWKKKPPEHIMNKSELQY